MNKKIFLLLLFFMLLGCDYNNKNNKMIMTIKSELIEVENEINEAIKKDAMYEGGIIKALIATRIELLKISKLLLKQKISILETGKKATIEINVIASDENKDDYLEKELALAKNKLKIFLQENNENKGGLLKTLAEAKIATQEQTIALLKNQILMQKYGLYLPAVSGHYNQCQNQTEKTISANDDMKNITHGDGPFGLTMGMSIDAFNGQLNEIIPGSYFLTALPPKPNLYFNTYLVKVAPKAGLCWVKAITEDKDSDRHGNQLRGRFDEIAKSLSHKYGESIKTDILLPGSIWEEPQYWMSALHKGDRLFLTQWNRESKAALPNYLESVSLSVRASSVISGRLEIEYNFINIERCNKEIEALTCEGI